MKHQFTLEELAQAIQEWCEEHQVLPANGQAAEQISERNIRYYRTLGLLDPPVGNYHKTFTEKHRLQLIAIRLYQAQGLPLRKIRDELYGKSLEDLVALQKDVGTPGRQTMPVAVSLRLPLATESWCVMPLTEEFLLISRHNKPLPRSILEKINQLLRPVCPENENTAETCKN